MTQRFDLAPMDALMRRLTALVLVLPAVFVGISVVTPEGRAVAIAAGFGLVALYAGIWLVARPTRFEVDARELRIVFPTWPRTIPRAQVVRVDVFPGDRFREQVGWGVRIGAGGLWGGFGLLVTPNGTLEMYISRTTDLVVVRCEGRRDLILSPGDRTGFAQALDPVA